MAETIERSDTPEAMAARVERTGPRRRGRWTYVVDRWMGDRWRLDGTNLDLQYDELNRGGGLPGAWVVCEGDATHLTAVDHFLDGAMGWVEDVVDGMTPYRDYLGRVAVPDWLARVQRSAAVAAPAGGEER